MNFASPLNPNSSKAAFNSFGSIVPLPSWSNKSKAALSFMNFFVKKKKDIP